MRKHLANLLLTVSPLYRISHQALEPVSKTQLAKWIRGISKRLRESRGKFKKFSKSSNRITATALLIIVALLPYLDIFLDFLPYVDTKSVALNSFANLSVAIWSLVVCIQATLVVGVSKLKPWEPAYLVLMYVNISMFCGFLFLEMNVKIKSDWVFRTCIVGLTLVLYAVGRVIRTLWRALFLEEQIDNELAELEYDQKAN